MNEYTYFVAGQKNRVDEDASEPSRAWVVFIDEKVRDMVYEKFGGTKGQLVKIKRGTTESNNEKAFYQGIPKSTECLPPRDDGIEGTIFTDPDFLKWAKEFVATKEEDFLKSADVQRREEEERNKGKEPEVVVAPLVAAMLKAKKYKERKKELKKKKKDKKESKKRKAVMIV